MSLVCDYVESSLIFFIYFTLQTTLIYFRLLFGWKIVYDRTIYCIENFSAAQLQVRTVLDIGCGFGSFVAHLLSLKLMPVCMASYESTGSP